MLVRNIQEIDNVANQYKLQLTFWQKWTDDRLKFNSFNGRIKYIIKFGNQIHFLKMKEKVIFTTCSLQIS